MSEKGRATRYGVYERALSRGVCLYISPSQSHCTQQLNDIDIIRARAMYAIYECSLMPTAPGGKSAVVAIILHTIVWFDTEVRLNETCMSVADLHVRSMVLSALSFGCSNVCSGGILYVWSLTIVFPPFVSPRILTPLAPHSLRLLCLANVNGRNF